MSVPGTQDLIKRDILVVDDTPDNLRLLTSILSERGYQVRPVPDGQLALAAVKAQPPDLILLDIRMPVIDGFQVCKALKADPKTREIPVIFISALDELDDKIKAFATGGVDYITKPFQIEEVLARVETHLTLYQLRQQLENANRKMSHELTLAGEIQRSFLPLELPELDGWDVAAQLHPAQETSGDFFDFRLRSDQNVELLIADVVDKGVTAALIMAFSWSIFRTYAEKYPEKPNQVIHAVNHRIIQDTHQSTQFLTVFYAVLNPATGKLIYCNAGHPHPLLFRGGGHQTIQQPGKTGTPLGLFDQNNWEPGEAQLAHGDVLVLYTDGVVEAQNSAGEFFGEAGLVQSAQTHLTKPAEQIASAIVEDLRLFMDGKAVADDVALMVLKYK